MKEFEALFGIAPQQIKKQCVIMPLFSKVFLSAIGARIVTRGKLYQVAENSIYSFIHSGMGQAFTGDAVLYLKKTKCKSAILFGSCGALKKSALPIGQLVMVDKCLALESFSRMLKKKNLKLGLYYPDRDWLREFRGKHGLKTAVCATVASLKQEEGLLEYFYKSGVDVLDMECSAFFSAGKSIGIRTVALFYITDIIKQKPFYIPKDAVSGKACNEALGNAARLLNGLKY